MGGNMKIYESFLTPAMDKYCLNWLAEFHGFYLDTAALESFHMNLASIVSFVASGRPFTNHTKLYVTKNGGIIDPSNSKEPQYIIDTAKPCPLLTELYSLRATKNASNTNKGKMVNGDTDSRDKFDKKFSWKNIDEFMEVMTVDLFMSDSKCMQIPRELEKETLKTFIFNFYEMLALIGRDTEKQANEDPTGEKDKEFYLFRPDPNSTDYKKYVVGRDGGIYQTEKYDDKEYFHCFAIELILNDKLFLDENLSFTNVKIGIDHKFDEWWESKLRLI